MTKHIASSPTAKFEIKYSLYLTGPLHLTLNLCLSLFLADEITASFRRFGPLVVDWPHKAESKSYFPPKGYAFLLFQVVQRQAQSKIEIEKYHIWEHELHI